MVKLKVNQQNHIEDDQKPKKNLKQFSIRLIDGKNKDINTSTETDQDLYTK